MAGCGATYEARHWGRDLKIVCVEKANIERSGAVAQGLYAINCYMGMQWDENQPEDHVRYARNDLMGLVREDLGYDIARHVDSTVHKFEEWGLPIMRDPETGRYHARRQVADHDSRRELQADRRRGRAQGRDRSLQPHHGDAPADGQEQGEPGRRRGRLQRAHAVISMCSAPRPSSLPPAERRISTSRARSARAWAAPGMRRGAVPRAYALPIEVGAKMTQMENRIVLTRFKDGYGPVGAYFLHLKTYTENAYGDEYESNWYENTKELVGDYIDRHPVPTCLRNHALLEELKAGRGPIRMVTKEAFQDPHKETIGWENFLGMTIGQAVVWASQNIDPKHTNPELTTSEPYVMGSHATCSGAWASGPEDYAPDEYQWGYNRMMTVDGLFGAGDTIGGTAHKFSSGSYTEGRIAAKAAVNYIRDLGRDEPQVSEEEYQNLKKVVFQPMENYEVGRNEIVAGTVSPSYLLPIQGLQRLEKIMDEYVGGISTGYMTNEPLLTRGLELLDDAQGRHGPHRGRRPAPAAARVGAAASPDGVRVRDAPHDVPQGNALAGLLLPRRSYEAG